jgi:pilus assembly protein CpaF
MVDARLPDGSRVNVIIPPLALSGMTVTIRKFGRRRMGMGELLGAEALSMDMARFLELAVRTRRNIVVSGGTGTGKTTLLNCLSELIAPGERIVTIEDSAELQLSHDNLVTLEARPRNSEGRGLVSIRDLVRNALRMRPDRIVVGECRGGEALDMLQAMNTGHDGSLTTAHANSPRDLLSRLEVMSLMAGMELPLAAVREQIASAINIVVQQARFACGSRRITSISEVTGTESGRIQMQDLFRFESAGTNSAGQVCGRFRSCGNHPVFLETLDTSDRTAAARMFEASSLAPEVQFGKRGVS